VIPEHRIGSVRERPSGAAQLSQQKGRDEGPPEAAKAPVTEAFMKRLSSITARIIQRVRDRWAGIMVAAQLVWNQTAKTASSSTSISAAPRHDTCSSRWCESCDTANTRSKKSSSGVTSYLWSCTLEGEVTVTFPRAFCRRLLPVRFLLR
jgi:hypothetical protein